MAPDAARSVVPAEQGEDIAGRAGLKAEELGGAPVPEVRAYAWLSQHTQRILRLPPLNEVLNDGFVVLDKRGVEYQQVDVPIGREEPSRRAFVEVLGKLGQKCPKVRQCLKRAPR